MTIRVSNKVMDLTGIGIEYLVDELGNVRAEFYDGNFVERYSQAIDANEITKGCDIVRTHINMLAVCVAFTGMHLTKLLLKIYA